MSSAINHRKRSRYQEQKKGAAYRAQRRQAYYRDVPDRVNLGLLGKLKAAFHRRAQNPDKDAPESENA